MEERRIIELGRAAGLTACGVATLEPSAHADHLAAWLARGHHADMRWMERTAEVRKNPRTKWTWARAALVGAVSYAGSTKPPAERPGLLAHVSRYAQGADYHDVVKARLRAWGDAVEEARGESFRRVALVDTSAVLERELAVRAGLGWIGKNTCLIADGGDSWRLLGVLLVDLELEPRPREPVTERCGTCRACLDACPTDAFAAPFVLDARRCISYLTIEHRGAMPTELEPRVGAWAFGCDVCQDVCPWNRRVDAPHDPDFAADPRLAGASLEDLLALDPETTRQLTRRTPLSRPKRAGLVRNAIVVATNLGRHDLVPRIAALVDDEDAGVAETARRALARLSAEEK